VHPFDWLLLRRSLLAAAIAAGVAASVVVTTDEATSTAAMRVARIAAFAPLIAAIAALFIVSHARSRGELRAIECLGVASWRAARGASLGAFLVAAMGTALLVSPWADAASLFPVVRSAIEWAIDPNGHAARAMGVVVSSDGSIALTARVAEQVRVAPAAWAALPCLLPIAATVSPWAVTPMSHATRGISVAAAGMAAVVCLHLVAAGRLAPSIGVVACVPLLAATVIARARS
jgi:hypothetical protein